jgi:hypothetical protein
MYVAIVEKRQHTSDDFCDFFVFDCFDRGGCLLNQEKYGSTAHIRYLVGYDWTNIFRILMPRRGEVI